MTRRLLQLLLLLVASSFGVAAAASKEIDALVEWINSQKHGSVSEKLEIRQIPDSEEYGFFAKETIEEDEVLVHIPWSMIIATDDQDDEDQDTVDCGTVRNVLQEFQLKEKSTYGPYISYLLSLPERQLPSAWSDQGKNLLIDILGHFNPIPHPIAPGAVGAMLWSEWVEGCDGDYHDDVAIKAAELVMQKNDMHLMVPLYDFFEHRNGRHTNTKTNVKPGKYHKVLATKQIQKGEQLYKTIDLCEVCNEDVVNSGYGTSEIFRDRGYIEKFPQRWTFKPTEKIATDPNGVMHAQSADADLRFIIDMTPEGEVTIEWLGLVFDNTARNFVRRVFRKHLQRLYRYPNVRYDMTNPYGVPEYEWNMTWKYYDAVKTALTYGLHSLVNDPDHEDAEVCHHAFSQLEAACICGDGQSGLEGSCKADMLELYEAHYHDLGWEEDDVDYIEPYCETSQIIEYRQYPLIDERQTNYQLLTFWERESDEDICMNLENTLQICSSYRPHYHEFFVHYPALFLQNDIKRVIFIGGGDAMLLHEVLKYPSLEKVVGLELDQQVTRKSFNYFKSQPHWDDPRVEWWYGDATKSLPLLPQDYWGSFDLVLVDLSETVMSMSVTRELDIFGAMAQLLTPNGIMVKNEPYLEKFSKFFDHTIHILYGTPKICTQVLVMGSNNVDFFRSPVKEHPEIERLLLEPMDDPSDRYKFMHDYRHNNATDQGKCEMKEGVVETQYGKKAGILDVIEAENISLDLTKTSDVEANIYSIVKEQGLTPVSEPSSKNKKKQNDNAITVIMKEGYVVARLFPDEKYCALDVHLWGAFEKSLALRSALTEALGSKSDSRFRIVAGGMFGSNTLEQDNKEIGIQVTQKRNCKPEKIISDENANDEEASKAALLQSLDILSEKPDLNAAVLCGFKDDEGGCMAVDLLTDDARVKNIIPIWTCPDLKDMDDETDFEDMYECEKDMEDLLTDSTSPEDQIDIIILDSSTTRTMAQILSSVLSYPNNRAEFLFNVHLIATMMKDDLSDQWRRNFLEQYRKEKHHVPLFRSEVVMKTGHRTLGLEILYCGPMSFDHFYAIEDHLIEALPDYAIEVNRITGGFHYYDPEYNVRVFPDSAYDRKPAIEQGKTQKALGRQSIFQFELKPPSESDEETDPEASSDDEEEDQNASEMPDFEQLVSFFTSVLDKTRYKAASIEKYTDVGDGAVAVAEFKEGSAVLVWDGEKHVDVNIFSSDQSEDRANKFAERFTKLSGLPIYLRDDQPRGTGKVIQFSYENLYR